MSDTGGHAGASGSPPAAKRKGPQWSSSWVIGFVLIAVLYFTGLLDQGFLYVERCYSAPWSIGDGALTGAWEGTVTVGGTQRRLILTIALHTKSRFSRTSRRNYAVSSTALLIVDGAVQLLGSLTVCSDAARGTVADIERYSLSGHANGNASKVELWPSEADRGARFGFESLTGAWRRGVLSAAVLHRMSASERTTAVTFRKLDALPLSAHC